MAAIMVGMESRKLNSSAEGRSSPTIWPAAMVDMERDVPGKMAESDWQMPIQMAWPRLISSTCSGVGLVAGGARVDDPHDDAAEQQCPGHDGDAAEVLFTHLVQGQRDDRGEGEGDESERDGVVHPGAVAAFAARKAFDEGDDAFEIEKKKSEDGAGLDDDGVHLPISVVERDVHERLQRCEDVQWN